VARALDCFAAVRFEGRQSLARGDVLGLAPEQARSFVVVARLRDTVERSQLFSQGEPGGLQRHVGLEANTWQTAGGRFGVYVVGNSFDAPLATHRELALHLLAVDSLAPGRRLADPPGLRYRVDGAAQPLALRSGPGEIAAHFARAVRTTLGDFAGPSGFGYRGDVFELMVYDRVLDAREQRALEAELAARYGIEVTSEP
jgi:hypothetical protein